MRERTIFLHGFSKAFAMTGWRIGYACGPAVLIDAMMKVHQYTMLCASIVAQEAALEALIRGWDSVLMMREQYHRRRDLVVRRFNEIGLKCHSPRGSFYAFPDVTPTGLSEKDFAVGLLQQERSRGGARYRFRRERQRSRSRLFRHGLRTADRRVRSDGSFRPRKQEVEKQRLGNGEV